MQLQADDLAAASRLCIQTFRGPVPWWQGLQGLRQELSLTYRLQQRLKGIDANTMEHKMVVAVGGDGQIVGFMEVGMLPPPVGFYEMDVSAQDWNGATVQVQRRVPSPTRPVQNGYRLTRARAALMASAATDEGYRVRPPDVPYLANLVVATDYRGRGVGSKLVKLAQLLVARKWPSRQSRLFVLVEASNEAAIRLYESRLFVLVEASNEAAVRLYEFRLFVLVEASNEAAIRLSEKQGFSLCDDDAQLRQQQRQQQQQQRRRQLHRQPPSQHPPRLTYVKDVSALVARHAEREHSSCVGSAYTD
ncbi:hypothetical protein JKP88DRAFT_321314 [Tribonema minus]|uniref:N-acetyltransferase domain-containing protein n=1 Tax=Tribonema minus TaxID=303371 RepID=A0A836CF34_9STRA|nr:hypothetical protein JKP88DRAFT_321314 [Tribonema minus]